MPIYWSQSRGRISSDNSCGFTQPSSRNNTDPRLGPLADNGGPTLTVSLLDGSPATDTANPVACPPTDQRGFPRPYGIGCDIGAFETTLIGTNDSTNSIQWEPFATNTVQPNGLFEFFDPGAATRPARFFKAIKP
jgi:hypothetical protein